MGGEVPSCRGGLWSVGALLAALALGVCCCTSPSADAHDAGGDDSPVSEEAGTDAGAADDAEPWATSPDICAEQPSPSCTGSACATSELAAHYLDLWWQARRETLDATPEEIASVFEVHSAELFESRNADGTPVDVSFAIRWVARVGWASAPHHELVFLGDYPLQPPPDDSLVLWRMKYDACTHLPLTVLSFDQVGERVRDCFPGGVATECWLSMELYLGPGCLLRANFGAAGRDLCYGASIDLETGEVLACTFGSCLTTAKAK